MPQHGNTRSHFWRRQISPDTLSRSAVFVKQGPHETQRESTTKKTLAFLLLASISHCAMAKWDLLGETDTAFFFLDPSSIVKRGNIVEIWQLTEHKEPQHDIGNPYRSVVQLKAFDCVQRTARVLSITAFSESLGMGRAIFSSNPSSNEAFSHVMPDTTSEAAWKYACRKSSPPKEAPNKR